MVYKFEIAMGWPNAPEERRSFRWRLEAHTTRFRSYRRVGIGWHWFLNTDPIPRRGSPFLPANVWVMGSYVARLVHQTIPEAKLYSIGERVSVRPGDEVAQFTLELS